MTDLRELLRAETAGLHEQLEELPFFLALRAGHLARPAIVSFLRSVAIIHAVLERELIQVSSPQIVELAKREVPKVPLLVADLALFAETEGLLSISAALQNALQYGAEILADAASPLSLVGTLYVLEGSQNGGVALKQAYAHCLGVRAEELSYFGCYGSTTAAHWKAFGKALNSLVLGDGDAQTAVRSAVRCFERLKTICVALYPYPDTGLKYHVAAINFEAGQHAMPQNPLEIALALRAGKTTWIKYPYLEHRFGERGKRFTSSDSCWLVAQTQMPVATATRHFVWLRTLLASRGIPTVILEAHLHVILQALAEEFPEAAEMRERVNPFLSRLDAERRALGVAESVPQLVEQFDRRFHACTGHMVESAAQLIASAWIDERSGITGARAALMDWFVDAGRFSTDWIANVRELVTELDQASCSAC